jgi:hypothetical protein
MERKGLAMSLYHEVIEVLLPLIQAFVKADAIASRSKTGHPDKKRLKNTSSGTPTSERQLTVRRWMCEPVGWRGPHDHPVALSYDNCAH